MEHKFNSSGANFKGANSITPLKSRSKFKAASMQANRMDLDFGKGPKRSSFLPDSLLNDKSFFTTKVARSASSIFLAPNEVQTREPIVRFCTGSKYIGQWNHLGMSGRGIYRFPHGVIYDGNFSRSGEFHGSGVLIYPNGQRIEGYWKNGKLSEEPQFVTKGNSVYTDTYCKMPDRRFQIEIEEDVNAATQEYLTNSPPPPRKIPAGCYDSGDGFYDPKIKSIRSYNNPALTRPIYDDASFMDEKRLKAFNLLVHMTPSQEQILNLARRSFVSTENILEEVPNDIKEFWIVRHCRKAWDEPIGLRPELYETWTTGSKKYEDKIGDMTERVSLDMIIPALLDNSEFQSAQASSNIYSFIILGDQEQQPVSKKSSDNSLKALSMMFIKPIAQQKAQPNRLVKIKKKSRMKASSSKKFKYVKNMEF